MPYVKPTTEPKPEAQGLSDLTDAEWALLEPLLPVNSAAHPQTAARESGRLHWQTDGWNFWRIRSYLSRLATVISLIPAAFAGSICVNSLFNLAPLIRSP